MTMGNLGKALIPMGKVRQAYLFSITYLVTSLGVLGVPY